MKFLFTSLLVFAMLCSSGQLSEKDLIKKTFDDYKTSILNDDADKALTTIDSRTKKYYTEILNNVKSADSVKINSLSIIDKVTILGIRAKASKNEIVEMKNTDAFIYAIKNGMVGKSSVVNSSIGEVKIDSNFAKGKLVVDGQQTTYDFHFYKEDGNWKLDITSLFSISNIAFKKMIEDSGKEENTLLFEILEYLSGKKITSDIWKPII